MRATLLRTRQRGRAPSRGPTKAGTRVRSRRAGGTGAVSMWRATARGMRASGATGCGTAPAVSHTPAALCTRGSGWTAGGKGRGRWRMRAATCTAGSGRRMPSAAKALWNGPHPPSGTRASGRTGFLTGTESTDGSVRRTRLLPSRRRRGMSENGRRVCGKARAPSTTQTAPPTPVSGDPTRSTARASLYLRTAPSSTASLRTIAWPTVASCQARRKGRCPVTGNKHRMCCSSTGCSSSGSINCTRSWAVSPRRPSS
mmetsp:Transcript_36651/g.108971  ORF Transcript_36651/g.108971 Transcript_36651/m.108971 type:complete len:257 (+) Transcript_36651:556-1326(+)